MPRYNEPPTAAEMEQWTMIHLKTLADWIDNEITSCLEGQQESDYRIALMLRADEINAGRGEAVPARMRRKIAHALRNEADKWDE
jgi:hypothetical protein